MSTDLYVYISDSTGYLAGDALTRLADTIANLDALLAPYSVDVTEVTDPTVANLVVDVSATSPAGGYDDGVLGCYIDSGEITLIPGWNWYTGADPAAIGADQYDFETIVTHELGHALGLGHSADTASTMHSTLVAGEARRTIAAADFNIRDTDGESPDGLHAVLPSPSAVGSTTAGTDSNSRAIVQSGFARSVNITAPTSSSAGPMQPTGAIGQLSVVSVVSGQLSSGSGQPVVQTASGQSLATQQTGSGEWAAKSGALGRFRFIPGRVGHRSG